MNVTMAKGVISAMVLGTVLYMGVQAHGAVKHMQAKVNTVLSYELTQSNKQ